MYLQLGYVQGRFSRWLCWGWQLQQPPVSLHWGLHALVLFLSFPPSLLDLHQVAPCLASSGRSSSVRVKLSCVKLEWFNHSFQIHLELGIRNETKNNYWSRDITLYDVIGWSRGFSFVTELEFCDSWLLLVREVANVLSVFLHSVMEAVRWLVGALCWICICTFSVQGKLI